MAFTASETTVSQLFQSSFGRPVSSQEGLTAWVERYDAKVTAGSSSAEAEQLTLAEMNLSDESTAIYNTKDEAATVDFIFTNSLGRTAVEPGRTAWVERAATIPLEQLQQEILASARTNDDFEFMDDLVQEADDALNAEVVNEDSIYLTSSTDRGGEFDGTADSDTFLAYIEQNSFTGGVSNSLSSADVLDGGASTDSLYAEIVPEFFGATGDNQIDIQARTTSIENIAFEARDSGSNDGDVILDGNDNLVTVNLNDVVTVDAKSMFGIEKIGSKNSDGDLVIENLTTLADDGETIRHTSEMTITMDHTDNMNSDVDASDLTVYFDEDYLNTTTSTSGSTLTLKISNVLNMENNENPVQGFRTVNFTVGETAVAVGVSAVTSYADVRDAINTALNDLGLNTVSATLGAAENAVWSQGTTIDGITFKAGDVAGQLSPVIITNTGSEELIKGEVVVAEGGNEGDINKGWSDTAAQESTNPISINVELDKVGRDGEGGDLIIGGKDQNLNTDTDVDQSDGINIFDITVLGDEDRPSNLGTITSTNNELDVVNVVSDNGSATTYSDLTVRGRLGQGQELTTINASAFMGDFSLGMTEGAQLALSSTFGAGDDSYNWGGEFEFDTVSSGKSYSIDMGAGDDTVIAALDSDAIDALGESFVLNTGSGDDTATITDGSSNGNVSDETQLTLDNNHVNLGSGEDTLDLNTEIITKVNAGTDSDFVRVDANNSIANGTTGSWSIGDSTDGPAIDWADRVLYEATLTVDFAGFEQEVTIDTTASNNFVATQEDINNAVIAAVAVNPELNRLLTTGIADGSADSQLLLITSTVQGVNDLTITVNQPTIVAAATALVTETSVATSHFAALEAGLIETGVIDSSAIPNNTEAEVMAVLNTIDGNLDETGAVAADLVLDSADGTDGTDNTTATSRAIVDMSTGLNDLIALDSDINSSDTVVFSANWDKVSIVNFDGTTVGTGAQAEVQVLTFSEAGDINNNGQVTVTINGENYTTAAGNVIATDDTAAGVSNKVWDQLVADSSAAANGTSITLDDGVVVVDNLDGSLTITYLIGMGNVAQATVTENIVTDAEVSNGAITVGGTDASAEVAAIAEVTTITLTDVDAVTFSWDNGVNTAFVDTDTNGTITIFEQAEQLAAFITTAAGDYTVTATNFSLGEVQVTNTATGDVDVLFTNNATPANNTLSLDGTVAVATGVVDINGAAAVAAQADVPAEQTITVAKGADQAGSINITTENNSYDIPVTVGNAQDVAVEIGAFLAAQAEFASATVNGDSTIDVVWAAGFGAEAIATFTDGAVKVATVEATTTQGSAVAGATANGDILDFTAWLDDTHSTSGSAASAEREASSFDDTDSVTTIDLESNLVTVLNDFTATATETWAGLTDVQLEDALNGTVAADDYANITTVATTNANVLAGTTLQGTSIDSILMIENDTNDGEYMVFNVETTGLNAASEAFAVTLVGTIDFGATQVDMTVGNIA